MKLISDFFIGVSLFLEYWRLVPTSQWVRRSSPRCLVLTHRTGVTGLPDQCSGWQIATGTTSAEPLWF